MGDLLTTQQMALFVARGFLRFDALVPESINHTVLSAIEAGGAQDGLLIRDSEVHSYPPGTPLSECYVDQPSLRQLLELPSVRGIIRSLVGKDPLFDHHAIHHCPPNQNTAQYTHADSIIDTRTNFDIQLMYYPHEITKGMGGTRYIPGSHFRRVNEMAIARYQNVKGQQHVICPAGTLLVMHHGIWHGGGRNQSDKPRYMFKIRLNATEKQVKLWDISDLDEKSVGPKAIFDPDAYTHRDRIQTIFELPEKWFPMDEGRLEIVNRIKLWRHLVGDDSFDSHYWLSRLENSN